MSYFSLYLIVLWIILLNIKGSRKVAVMLTPWLMFGCAYDWMRLVPNYEVNAIDVRGLYEAEKALFGITTAEGRMILGEWFSVHHWVVADVLAGCFYLMWVPLPMTYAFWLFGKGRRRESARMSWAFLWVNLFGFVFYYLHPAAPPWYVMEYGFEPIIGVAGNVAGLGRFDDLIGIPIFASIYTGNSNIYAAVPSLHSAYVLTASIYVVINRGSWKMAWAFFGVSVGIWLTAVYTCHHYVIDVLLGIAEAIVAIAILEVLIRRIPLARRFFRWFVGKVV